LKDETNHQSSHYGADDSTNQSRPHKTSIIRESALRSSVWREVLKFTWVHPDAIIGMQRIPAGGVLLNAGVWVIGDL
jgi:hypothetical protein